MKLLAISLLIATAQDCSMTATVKPLGLITQPNRYGQYDSGALHTAYNVAMRDPGVLQVFPATQTYRAAIGTGTLYRIYPRDSSVLAFSSNAGTWTVRSVTSGAATSMTAPSGVTVSFDTGKLRAVTVDGRNIFTSTTGPIVLDGESDTTMRMAGVPPPSRITTPSFTTTNAQVMPDNTAVNYRAYIERTVTIGTQPIVLIGAVSGQCYASNESGSTADKTVLVQWAQQTGVAAGDLLRIFKTKQVASGNEPGDTMYLAITYTITSTDVSNNYASVRDTCAEGSLGEELYTNPGQQGIRQNNWVPPLADDVEVFAGHTFYASRRLQNQYELHVPGGWGALTSDAQRTYGVGQRDITGDTHSNTTIDNISASHMKGLVVGQLVIGDDIPSSTTITAVGASSITISNAATATAAASSIAIYDRFDVDGTVVSNGSASDLASQLFALHYLVYADRPFQSTALDATALLTRYYGGESQMSIRATNGPNFSPALPILTDTAKAVPWDERPSRLHFSKKGQPEAVPIGNALLVGRGTVYRMVAVTDRMYIFASDGLWELTGSDGVWRVEQRDSTLVLAARDSAARMGEKVFAYTNKGLVAIEAGSVREISRGVIATANEQDTYSTGSLPGAVYADSWDTHLACDELHNEAWVRTNSSQAFVWNETTGGFTKFGGGTDFQHVAYSRALRSLVMGDGQASPSVIYFQADTASDRVTGAIIEFQPMSFGNPAGLKEFVDVEWILSNVNEDVSAYPIYNDAVFVNGPLTFLTSVSTDSGESRAVSGVPVSAPSSAAKIQVGLQMDTNSDATAWKLLGVDVTYRKVNERRAR